MTDDLNEMGPIDYLVVEFPGSRVTGEAPRRQRTRPDTRSRLHPQDLDGSVVGLELSDLDGDGTLDLSVFEGASSGLLGENDIQEAGNVLEPGSSAGILVHENVWAGPFAAAVRRSGG